MAGYQKASSYDTRKQYAIKHRYGLSREELDTLLTRAEFKCEICKTDVELNKTDKTRVCIDHDHATGKVRGILCHPCNTVIGLLKDNINTLESAKEYLTTHA